MKGWGRGNYYQLGHSGQTNWGDSANELGDNMPAVELGDFYAVKVDLGYYHTCALSSAGKLKCWVCSLMFSQENCANKDNSEHGWI